MYLPKAKRYMLRKKQACPLPTLKQLLLWICFSFAATRSHAQVQKQHTPVAINPLQDKLEYQAFTIRLIPTVDGYYGFDILQRGKLVLHQTKSPLPNAGLTHKEDAFTTARWLINEYRQNGHFPRLFSPGFERQLPSAQPANQQNQ